MAAHGADRAFVQAGFPTIRSRIRESRPLRAIRSLGLVGRVPLARVMILKEAGRVVDLHPLWRQAEMAIRAFIAKVPSQTLADQPSPADAAPGA